MLILIKKFNSLVILSCFFVTIFHNYFHVHNYYENISCKIINGEGVEHHLLSKECETCLTKNNQLEIQYATERDFYTFSILSIQKFENYKKISVHFNLSCRPPPIPTT